MVDVKDTLTEDFRVTIVIPSITGSTGNSKIAFGLFVDGVSVMEAEESVGNAEIPVSATLIRERGAPQIQGLVPIEVKIKNVTGTAIVDNTVGTGGNITVETYQDQP